MFRNNNQIVQKEVIYTHMMSNKRYKHQRTIDLLNNNRNNKKRVMLIYYNCKYNLF